ncbi:hypothetical protein ABZW10_33155 [Kitasatospora sp. NPDC004723]|uniref:hypothetical protein n=1 Tax=Kitasatospora sp. NPDC004723 TaxID=3154288 RepID=UPI0033A3B007
MSDDRTPQQWRELLARATETPPEARTGKRRDRRSARAGHRAAGRKEIKEALREERAREPINPAGALLVVAVVIGIGAALHWLWPGLNGDRQPAAAPPAATSAPAPVTTGAGPAPTATTSSPSPTASPVDRTNGEAVAREAVRLYLTRDPVKDQDHRASVDRAAPYLTAALVDNLKAHTDPAFDKLNSQSGIATVTAVTLAPAGTDLPPDNPLRIWRKATAAVTVEGYTTTTQTTELRVEVTLDGDRWRVSAILGLGA